MALATDANISKLQQMFPTVEGDVIAIVLNDCGNNVDKCVNYLLEMSCEASPVVHSDIGPAHHTIDHAHNKPSPRQLYNRATKSASPKKEVWSQVAGSKSPRNKKSQGKAVQSEKRDKTSSGGGHGNSIGNHGDKPHLLQQDSNEPAEMQKGQTWREGGHYSGGVAPWRPVLLPPPFPPPDPRGLIGPPDPRGLIRPPGIMPPPPLQQTNWQYYPRGFHRPPPWGDHAPPWTAPPYNSDYYTNSQDMQHLSTPMAHGGTAMRPSGTPMAHGGTAMRPSGTPMVHGGTAMRPSGAPMAHGGMAMRPSGAPMAHGGMAMRPSGTPMAHGGTAMTPSGTPMAHGGTAMRPSGTSMAHGGMAMRPSGTPMAHGGTAMTPSGTPMAHGGTAMRPSGTSMAHGGTVITPGMANTSSLQEQQTYRLGLETSDSHTPISPDHQMTGSDMLGWPIDTVSESGTEHGNPTGSGDDGIELGGSNHADIEKTGKEWMNWTYNDNNASVSDEKRLVLLRGLPGSGKTALARELVGKYGIICSTDDLFVVDGRYEYDFTKLNEYHNKTKENARQAMLIEITPVIIDNTNIATWEMKPYVELAQRLKYKVEILEPSTPWKFDCEELARRNVHGVPFIKILKMLGRYERDITVESILASSLPATRQNVKTKTPRSSNRRGNNTDRNSHTTSHMTSRNVPKQLTKSNHKQPVSKSPASSRPVVSDTRTSSDTSDSHSISTIDTLTTASSSVPSSFPRSPVPSTSSHQSGTNEAVSGQEHTHSPATTLLLSPHQTSRQSVSSKGHGRSDPLANGNIVTVSSGGTATETEECGGPLPKDQSPHQVRKSMTFQAFSSKDTFQPLPKDGEPSLNETFQPLHPSYNNTTLADGSSARLQRLTKEEEEERAAQMSRIWGDGRLSDDTEIHLDSERRGGDDTWEVDEGQASLSKTVANLSWDQLLPLSGTSVWSSLDDVGGGVGAHESGLVGRAHPLPCKYGPIGTTTNRKTLVHSADSGTTLQTKMDHQTVDYGNSNVPAADTSNEKDKRSLLMSPPEQMIRSRPCSRASRNRSSSAELWVSEEMENWPCEMPDGFFLEGEREGGEAVIPTLKPSHDHDSKEVSSVIEGEATVNPANYEVKSDSSFDDPAIVNMVKEKSAPKYAASGLETNPLWKDDVDLEPESQETLFPTPSSETFPESKQHGSAHPPSPSLFLQPPPGVYSNNNPPHKHSNESPPGVHSNESPPGVHSIERPPGMHCNKSTAPSSNDDTTTVEYSTPTLVPPDYDDCGLTMGSLEEQEKWSNGDYFPSAFEQVHTVDVVCSEISGEPPNDVTVTSSDSNDMNPLPLSVTCVSTAPADSDKPRPGRNLSPLPVSGEDGGRSRERGEFALLEAPSVSSIQESSVDPNKDYLLSPVVATQRPPGEEEEEEVGGTVQGASDASDPESDLAFLVECFPDLGTQFLRLLLQMSHGNVEEAVSTALVSTISSPTPPVLPGDVFTLPLSYEHRGRWEGASESSAASVTSESEMEGTACEEDECVNDEEIARVIQEQINSADSDFEGAGLRAVRSVTTGERGAEEEGEGRDEAIVGEAEDENLVLRLSRSLAAQLQQMFGSIQNHLPLEGVLRDEDLLVLLSERAAHQIWQKWIDTLEAKKVEIRLHQDPAILRTQSAPQIQAVADSRPPACTGTEPGHSSLSGGAIKQPPARTGTEPGHSSLSGGAIKQPAAVTAASVSGKVGRRIRPRKKKREKDNTLRQAVTDHSYQELEDRPSYDDLRAEAALHAKLRSEAFQKAAHARSCKQGDVAVFYAQQGHSHTEKMKEANRRAADLILKLQNDMSSQDLDLHGLHVEEAIAALQERLHCSTDGVLYVITGKGIHSKGEARLKPAVTQFLRNNNYMFEVQPGRVKVKLTLTSDHT